MRKQLLILLLIVACYPAFCQDVGKILKTEADGFKWYLIKTESGEVSAESFDGHLIVPSLKSKDYYIYYSKTGYGDHSSDKRPSFFTANKHREHGGSFEVLGAAIFSSSGENIIPFSRGYKNITYVWLKDNVRTYFTFEKVVNGKTMVGVCDIKGREIIEPKYQSVSYMIDGFTGNTGGLNYVKLNIFLDENSLVSTDAILDKHLCTEDDGFRWYKTFKKGVFGAEDISGKTLIPLSRGYTSLFYNDMYGGNFRCELNGSYIECDLTGKVLSEEEYSNMRENHPYIPKNSASNNGHNASNESSNIKEMFDLAYNTPDTEAQTKYNRYMQVIQADAYNSYGYKAAAYNNLGVLYETLGDLKNAKACYEYALQANPNYDKAKDNLKNVKAQRRSQRWNNISNALGAVGQALGTMSGGQTNGTYNTYQGDGGSYGGSSGGSSSGERTCDSCGGSGKCATQGWADKYRCHGSGRCQHCNNTGTQRDYGHTRVCSTCNGTKKCHYCGGSGRCSNCGGSGKK